MAWPPANTANIQLIDLGGGLYGSATPAAPTDAETPVVTARATTSMTVEFIKGTGATSSEYRYRDANNAPQRFGAWSSAAAGATDELATVTGLSSNSLYEIQVRSLSSGAPSNWTKAVRSRTHASVSQAWDIEAIPYPTVANATLTTNAGFAAWPIDPFMIQAPANPGTWPASETTDRFYINNSDGAATDAANTYGYPDKPRLTSPEFNNLNAGTVITYGTGHVETLANGNRELGGSIGTSGSPIWFRGESRKTPVQVQGVAWITENTDYCFFENFIWNGGNTSNGIFGTSNNGAGNINHLVLRHCEITDIDYISGGGGIIGIGSDDRNGGKTTENVIMYDLNVHDNAQNIDWTTGDFDQHGIAITARVTEPTLNNKTKLIWNIDNVLTECSGNGIQCVSFATPSTDWRVLISYVFSGGNRTGFCRQGGLWSKRASHVIFAENESLNSDGNNAGGNGQLAGCQYGPDRLWYIKNRMSDGWFGIMQTDTSDPEPTQDGRFFILENVLSELENFSAQTDAFRQGTAISFTFHGNMIRYVMNNTIYNAVNGIVGQGGVNGYTNNNVISLRDGSNGTGSDNGEYFELFGTALIYEGDLNLSDRQDGSSSYLWDATQATTAAAFDLASAGNYTNSSISDPLFNNISAGDVRLQAGSPALVTPNLVAGDSLNPYTEFSTLYGLTLTQPTYLGAEAQV